MDLKATQVVSSFWNLHLHLISPWIDINLEFEVIAWQIQKLYNVKLVQELKGTERKNFHSSNSASPVPPSTLTSNVTHFAVNECWLCNRVALRFYVSALKVFTRLLSVDKSTRPKTIKSMCLKMTLLGDSFIVHQFFFFCLPIAWWLDNWLNFGCLRFISNSPSFHTNSGHKLRKPNDFNGQKVLQWKLQEARDRREWVNEWMNANRRNFITSRSKS